MPASVSYLQKTDALHLRFTTDNAHASPFSASMSTSAIAVRPPSQTKTNKALYPPIIAKLTSSCASSVAHCFATAVLLGDGGQVIDALDGTTAATGVSIDSSCVAFAFHNLKITKAGVYSIRLDMYAMPGESASGATLVSQLATGQITASETDTAPQEPSPEELAILRQARDAGVPLPP